MGASEVTKHFTKLYYKTDGASFYTGSAPLLLKEYRLKNYKPHAKLEDAENFLSAQKAYTVHRKAYRRHPRNRIFVQYIGDILAIDLADMRHFSDKNDGYNYMFCAIDAFSKKSYAVGMKTKTAKESLAALIKIRSNIDYRIHNICVDSGTEFKGDFSRYCKAEKINLYTAQGGQKNSIAERFIQTIKNRLWRYYRDTGIARWIDILPKMLKAYNDSYHRSIKMKPDDVSNANSAELFLTLFPKRHTRKPSKFKVGDIVRYSKTFDSTQKSYEGNWSLSVYRIIKIKYPPKGKYAMYFLEEAYTKKAFGTYWWYGKQLQKVDTETFAGKDTAYDIEVIRKKGNMSLIKYLDYDDSKPVWVKTKSLIAKS